MEDFIALFPLKLVAFPGENLNLHVFEPRYKELVNDVFPHDRRFGIPPYLNNTIEYGTLMEVVEISKIYTDGRMDIKTMGLKVFRVLDYSNPVNGKSYSAGNVKYIESHDEQDPYMKSYMIEKLEEFFSCIHYIGKPSITQELISYDIIHKLGLTLEEEYKILKMEREIDRQEFITGYLDRMIPALKRAEKVGDIIKMNGHFKYLDPINF